jgi:hypothetical protein
MRDLVLLVPDKNTEATIRGALVRHQALGIRQIDCHILVEQDRDGGVRCRGAQVLNVVRGQYSYAAMIMDYEGSGANVAPAKLEAQLDGALSTSWGDHCKAIVIEPEVDVWMWGSETHLRSTMDWEFDEDIRSWLENQGFAFGENGKPVRPKEALEAAFRRANVPRSSARYEYVAQRLSLVNCTDAAFQRLRSALVTWFGAAVR